MNTIYKGVMMALCGLVLIQPAVTQASEDNAQTELLKQIVQQQLMDQLQQVSVGDRVTATATNDASCRNTQITRFAPQAGSHTQDQSYIEYWVRSDAQVLSFEATINGRDMPVEYRVLDDGSYRARVRVPSDMKGSLFVAMGAGSDRPGACNSLLETSMVVGAGYDSHGNPVVSNLRNTTSFVSDHTAVAPKRPPVTVVPENKKPVAVQDGEVVEGAPSVDYDSTGGANLKISQESDSWFGTLKNWVGLGKTQDSEDADEIEILAVASDADSGEVIEDEQSSQDTDGILENNDAGVDRDDLITKLTAEVEEKKLQQAAVVGSIAAAAVGTQSSKNCTTIGSYLPWYVWLGIVWLWLVILWGVVSVMSERMESVQYARRLSWIVLTGVLGASALWWFINPCFTNAWVPICMVLLGGLVYWLYSEEVPVVA